MTSCVFRYCKNTGKNVNDSLVSFHRFVHTDHPKREEWIRIVQKDRSEATWLPSKSSHICSAHFQAEDMYLTKTGKRFLKKSAVPRSNPSEYNADTNPPASPTSLDDVPLSDSESIFDSPGQIKLKKDLAKALASKKILLIKYRKLQRQHKNLKKKTETLTAIIKKYKETYGINERVEHELVKNSEIVEMYSNTLNKIGKSRKKIIYSPSIKKFAQTCYNYSPAAYKHVRQFFQNALPHQRTLNRWHGSIDAEPGFTDESFKSLKLKCDSTSEKVICSLVFDEMALGKLLLNDKKLGYVNFGDCPIEGQEDVEATQVLVFMLVSMTEHWKIPVGFFLAADISADSKASLIKICLQKCSEAGVLVPSITFNGCPANFQAVEKLGCNFADADNLITYFTHPSTSDKVYVLIDPCNFMKLIRNTFENKKLLYDEDDQLIKWQLLENLNRLQQSQGHNFANKLSPWHIYFRNQMMKVKLATQLLSMTVANTLILCDKELDSAFLNFEGTVKFITTLNDLFDVLNSQSCNFYGYKRPLDAENNEDIFTFLDNVKKYISTLQFHVKQKRKITMPNQEPRQYIHISKNRIVESNSKAGFIGALICIESMKGLYSTLVETSVMKCLSTYRLSQHHLELFFGCIRREGGNDKNPNVLEFSAAYKKVLKYLELRSSLTENCIPMDNFAIFNWSSVDVINDTALLNRHDDEEFRILENESPIDSDRHAQNNCIILADHLNSEQLMTTVKLIVGFISGYVARRLNEELKCEECISSLVTSVQMWYHKLIQIKDMGGLCYSTEDVYKICLKTETLIRHLMKFKGHDNTLPRELSNINTIVCKTLKTFINSNIFDTLFSHALQQPCTLNHRTHLIRAVIEQYAKIRLHHEDNTDLDIGFFYTERPKLILFEGN